MHYMNKAFSTLNEKTFNEKKATSILKMNVAWKYFFNIEIFLLRKKIFFYRNISTSKKKFRKKKSNTRLSTSVAQALLLEVESPFQGFVSEGQIVDQRLTLNESQRKTALTITTPRSSTRSFANDLAPRLSTRELTLTQGDACRTHEGRY